MKEIKPLTSLRSLAAIVVFMYHYAWLLSPGFRGVEFSGEWIPLMFMWRQGQVGVSIFFVLSGFLITRIYFDGIADRTTTLRLFFVKRIARIWPLFLVFAIIQHAVEYIAGRGAGSTALVTMTMSQGFFEGLRYSGLRTAWSLTIEETFYAFAPVLFLVLAALTLERGRRGEPLTAGRFFRVALVVGLVAVVLAGCGEGLVRLANLRGWTWNGFMASRRHMLHSTLFGRFPEFALGILAAFLHRGLDLNHVFRGRRAGVVVGVTSLGIIACMWGKDYLAVNTPGKELALSYLLAYVLALLAAVMILALTVVRGPVERLLSHRAMVYHGKISYGFYLIQGTVMMTPLVALTDRLGYFRMPVLFVLTSLVCAAFYEIVEAPSRRAIVVRWGRAR